MIQKTSKVQDIRSFIHEKRFGTVASIYFGTDGAELDPQDISVIRETCNEIIGLRTYAPLSGCGMQVFAYGYADCRGSIGHNLSLGQARADAVRAELQKFLPIRVAPISMGEDFSAQVRGRNELIQNLQAEDRRVDIVLSLENLSQIQSVADLRRLREEMKSLRRLLAEFKSYEMANKLGPAAYLTPGDYSQQGYQDAVKGLDEALDTRNKTLGPSLLVVLKAMVIELPPAIVNILWVTYWAPTVNFVDTSTQLIKKSTGTAPEGAGLSQRDIIRLRERLMKIQSLIDEVAHCQISRGMRSELQRAPVH